MKRLLISVMLISCMMMTCGNAEDTQIWDIINTDGQVLTQLATEPAEGDCYITSDNQTYRILSVENGRAMAEHTGMVTLFNRRLGNQFLGQIIKIIAFFHSISHNYSAGPTCTPVK